MDPQETENTAGDYAADYIQDVLDAMELDAEVEVEQGADNVWRLNVIGPDAGEVVGAHGAVLNALQYLAGMVAQRASGGYCRLQLNADRYREKREQHLTETALAIAAEVVRMNQEAELDPLSAYERRIIHNALQEYPGITTYSEGEEPERRVIVAPKPLVEE